MSEYKTVEGGKIDDAIFQLLVNEGPMTPYQLLTNVMQELGYEDPAPIKKQYRILLTSHQLELNHDMEIVSMRNDDEISFRINDTGINMREKTVSEVESYYRRKVIVYEWKKIELGKWELEECGKAKFHEWGVNFEERELGVGHFSTAIIEREDGSIENVPAELIKFVS